MSLRARLSSYWCAFQAQLFPAIEEDLGPLGERYQFFITVLEFVRVEQHLPCFHGLRGRCRLRSRQQSTLRQPGEFENRANLLCNERRGVASSLSRPRSAAKANSSRAAKSKAPIAASIIPPFAPVLSRP